ncbi:Mov34/MPN/PAD-1 family protein [uncultured Microbulbifer sp.]|uniref:Mov34/MPN/PAD-1 family protein n=1 Tax=uncultured Microbulbifer sp. TaxID=348147 RepID=UPI00344F66E8
MLQQLSSGHIVWHSIGGNAGSISPNLISELQKWKQVKASSREAGGLLLGFIDLDTEGLLAETATVPGRGDQRSRIKFFRGPRHQKLAIRWNHSTDGRGTQLGLWHTHPEPIPTPSSVDINDCRNVLTNGEFVSNGLLYVIVGIDKVSFWFAKKGRELEHLGYF